MKQYYDVNTVAEKLEMDPQTIYRWIRSGKLEAKKAGRNWRITEQNVERTLEEQPGNLAERLDRTLELDQELTEKLQDYEAENGEIGLRQLAQDALRKEINESLELNL